MTIARPSWLLALALLPVVFSTNDAQADMLAPGDPESLLDLNEDFITNLSGPTSMAFLPDGRIVVTEKGGALKMFEADGSNLGGAGAQYVAATFPVDDSSEKGLLKVVVHPDFATNRLLIFYYSREGTPVQARHRVVAIPLGENNMLDVNQETILVDNLIGPANHDGGGLAISNGMLYIGVGDTGCNKSPISGDGTPQNYNPTCLTNANGKVLRINLDGSIPPTNPLVGMSAVTSCQGVSPDPAGTGQTRCVAGDGPTTTGAAREEIFAWGFRNPWRLWVDPQTNYVWVGDVGEQHNEEINVITAGGKHYGWPFREGTGGDPASVCTGVTTPDPGTCVEPTYFYTHADGNSITGGLIIDDCRWPEQLRNRYVFGDAVSGMNWSMAVNATRDGLTGQRADFVTGIPEGSPGSSAVDFEMGPDGGLYYVAFNGHIARVAPLSPIDCNPGSGGAGGAAAGGSAGAASGGAPGGGTTGTSGGAPGTGGASGGAPPASGGASPASGGSSPGGGGQASGDDGGCGCRVAGGGGGTALGLLALALGSLAFGSRRKGRSVKTSKRN